MWNLLSFNTEKISAESFVEMFFFDKNYKKLQKIQILEKKNWVCPQYEITEYAF